MLNSPLSASTSTIRRPLARPSQSTTLDWKSTPLRWRFAYLTTRSRRSLRRLPPSAPTFALEAPLLSARFFHSLAVSGTLLVPCARLAHCYEICGISVAVSTLVITSATAPFHSQPPCGRTSSGGTPFFFAGTASLAGSPVRTWSPFQTRVTPVLAATQARRYATARGLRCSAVITLTGRNSARWRSRVQSSARNGRADVCCLDVTI